MPAESRSCAGVMRASGRQSLMENDLKGESTHSLSVRYQRDELVGVCLKERKDEVDRQTCSCHVELGVMRIVAHARLLHSGTLIVKLKRMRNPFSLSLYLPYASLPFSCDFA